MKKTLTLFGIFTIFILAINCGTSKNSLEITEAEKQAFEQTKGDTIAISSDKTEYEIIIIEPGFTTWLNSIAKPRNYYSQSFFESRNWIMVNEWNQRVLQPNIYNRNLYELQIDYKPNIDYGYEVNYKLYNYFIYFQRKYNQRLGPFIPRI
jgi:signal peptidase I